ncbi:MAG: 2-C-methyl-D-erythritol 4-phosphate cytidylyltransferase [Bacteroidetes bacterium]|nr:MAG: 2-C-methyl-D-erythritol 4-phosphate cytidylyltransferase [Bacteroidota bacterium]
MNTCIITAGGLGKRMGGTLPKQFLMLGERSILHHSLSRFYEYDPEMQLLLTLPESWFDYWKEYCQEHEVQIPHTLVSGGQERYHSIREALALAKGKLIAVHDGVRPLVDQDTIARCFDAAAKKGAAVPVIPLKDSIRRMTDQGSEACKRKDYVLVQTPQVFQADWLQRAYEQDYHEGITDDASLLEEQGYSVELVDGNEQNMKITTEADLQWARVLLTI